jgi:hypothetical protein
MNIAAIRTAQEGYFAEFGIYVPASASPAANGGSVKQDFADTGTSPDNFDTVGWKPEGQVYFNYAVEVTGTDYTIDASADLDADATNQLWAYVRTLDTATPGGIAGAIGCAATDVVGAGGVAGAVNQVGPCDPTFGQSIF